MHAELPSHIERFISSFRGDVNQIEEITCKSGAVFKKTIYVSLLDALSRSVHSSNLGNRARFVSLIRSFGDWEHAEKISLPHLVRLLKLVPDPAYEELRIYADTKIESWKGNWGEIGLSQDLNTDEVSKHWLKGKDQILGKVPVEHLRHCHLLWAYRNALIHELRAPGYGMEGYGDYEEPFYHELSTIGTEHEPAKETIELVYPVPFFKKLCISVLSKLEDYLSRNRLDPYDNYKFGTYWIDELN